MLTVIANESYDDFANGLQKELEAEDFKFGVITPESFTKVTVKGDDGVEERSATRSPSRSTTTSSRPAWSTARAR